MKKKILLLSLCLSSFAAGIGAEWLFIRHQVAARAAEVKALKEAKSKSKEAKEAAKRWDPLPTPATPAYGEPITVPKLAKIAPLDFIQSVDGLLVQGSDLDVLLRGRFFKIIDSNPDQEIMDFAAKARSGEVRVKFGQMPPNKLAIFHLWPIDGDMTLGGRQLDRFIPEIVINLAFIIKVGQPDGLRLFQVMLDHEYRHYRQFMMTTDESLRHSYIAARPVAGQPISARICAFNWQNEIDAYRHSYEKAVRWGFHDDFSARVGDAKSFNQLVFKNISPNAATMSPECLPVWAKAAGHPHPEAFEP